MTLFIRSYKYRLYPSKSQMILLDRSFGAVRFIWNQLVANFHSYGTDSYIKNLNEVQIKKDNPWLQECISYAIQQKRMDFFETTKQYFNKNRKTKLGRMKFKKRGVSNDSFRIPGQAVGYEKAFISGTVRIPKIGRIKVITERIFSGKIKSFTVSKTKTNEYYISVCVEEEINSKYKKTFKDVGIDLGLSDLLILSDGTKFQNPKYFRETQAKLKKAQQHFSRKVGGSKRRENQRLKVAKIHQKITRQKNWYYHQISNYLIENFDSICLEDLAVKNMIKNRKLSKSITDASWPILVGMISYKAKWDDKEVLKVNRFFPSSKTCSCCGHKLDRLELGTRSWACPTCEVLHDRDVNAAINILKEAMIQNHGESVELPDYNRGEVISPDWFRARSAASTKRLISSDISL